MLGELRIQPRYSTGQESDPKCFTILNSGCGSPRRIEMRFLPSGEIVLQKGGDPSPASARDALLRLSPDH